MSKTYILSTLLHNDSRASRLQLNVAFDCRACADLIKTLVAIFVTPELLHARVYHAYITFPADLDKISRWICQLILFAGVR